jgi:hypothetical protein
MKHDNCGYENVVFCPGVDASEPLEKLSERGSGAAIEYLAPRATMKSATGPATGSEAKCTNAGT